MSSFWTFTRGMLRYRGDLALSLMAALVSALCYGVGIATIPLVLKVMLAEGGPSLDELAAQFGKGHIPDGLIAILPADKFTGILAILGIVCLLTVIGAIAKYLHAFLSMSVAIRTVANVRKAAFYRIVHLPMRTVVSKGVVDQISRIIRDSNQLRNGFNAIFSKGILEILKGATTLALAFFFSWKLALIAIITAPILAFVIRVFGKKVKKASRRALVQSSALLGAIMEAIQGIRVVKVHTAERAEVGRFNRVNKRLLAQELSMRQAKALASPVIDTITVFGIAAVGAIAAWFVLEDNVQFDHVMGTVFMLAAAGAAVRPLTQLSTEVHESAAAAERLTQLLEQDVECSRNERRPRLAPHTRSLEFDRVSFTYAGADHPAIDKLSLSIRHGEVVAFVGPNGSGKTTLLSLVPRLFDADSGRVLIDGVDVRDASLKSLRQQIGVVTQDVVMFNDTIANNIAYGAGHVSRDEIEDAARRAYADEFIRAKPDGYDTVVGEQGVTLSGGQRQRIAIARAILRDPRILILDEATSMIDADSEALINAALDRFCRSRTSLVIAHRLSTVIDADRIVVMNAGRIVDVGHHRELIERCKLYQQLCRTQLATPGSAA